ncbi:MAG: NAD kinase [Bacteroidales bacterium]|nr:NAD kinase [Bacteroidales bacterium]
MKLALFGKDIREKNKEYLIRLIRRLKEYDAELLVHESYYPGISEICKSFDITDTFKGYDDLAGNTDMVLSIGGDGTLLDTVSLVRDSGIPVLGINLGRLGFLSSISCDDLIPAIDKVMAGQYTRDQRTLLKLESKKGLFGEFSYALNDLTVTRKDSTALVVIHVYVDNLFLNSYWADGLIVATPTGSTAYSMSSGGPIVSPGSENFVITPIAPHNLTIRPIVVSDKSEIRISVEGRDKKFLVSIDSKTDILNSGDELILKTADFKFNLVQIENKDFFTTIRDKLKWGLDVRN